MINSIQRKQFLDCIPFILMLSVGPICWALPSIPFVSAIVASVAFVVYLVRGNRIYNRHVFPIAFYCLLFFGTSFLFTRGNTFLSKYFVEFLLMGICSLLIAQVDIDKNVAITCTCVLSIVLIPTVTRLDFVSGDTGMWMGFSYGTLRFIIALVYALLFITYGKRFIKPIFSAVLFIYVAFYALYASRGAILAVIVFLFLAFYISQSGKSHFRRLMPLLALFLIMILWTQILDTFQNLLDSLGLDFYALDKLMRMVEDGDISNGREDVLKTGLSMAYESPIWGNGIASFEMKYNNGWVHNIFAELFIEGGILLLTPFAYYIVRSIRYLMSDQNPKEERYFLALLLAGGLTELLFSSYLWRSQVFWLYIGYVIKLDSNKHLHNEII